MRNWNLGKETNLKREKSTLEWSWDKEEDIHQPSNFEVRGNFLCSWVTLSSQNGDVSLPSYLCISLCIVCGLVGNQRGLAKTPEVIDWFVILFVVTIMMWFLCFGQKKVWATPLKRSIVVLPYFWRIWYENLWYFELLSNLVDLCLSLFEFCDVCCC